MTKMIPPVPTSAVMLPTPKQKIGFSIASIVGNDAHTVGSAESKNNNNNNKSNGEDIAANENCKINNNNISSENNKNTILNSNHNQEHEQNDNNSSITSTTTTTASPPQTPPAVNNNVIGSTHMPTGVHLPQSPSNAHQQQQSFNALPQHLTAVQQHALHQHLLLQHHHHQQQQQQQQLQHQLQQHHQQQQQQQQQQSPKQHQDHIQDLLQRLQNTAAHMNANFSAGMGSSAYSPPLPQTRLSPVVGDDTNATMQYMKRNRSPTPVALENAQNPAQRMQPPQTPPKSVSPQSSQASSPAPPPSNSMPVAGSQFLPKGLPPGAGNLLMPGLPPAGLVRPFSMGPVGTPNGPPPTQQGLPDIKALPPYINAPPDLPPQQSPHLFTAAQFHMAAALQAGHVLGPAAAAAAGLPPLGSPFMQGPGMPRESYPLHPWIFSRHGRLFPHRFPGNFLLQPFRKPKRIRTAFSPSQLLKLEHAFESNQYVVGAERKALAQSLNLSETQVKVWFQNRRTKHKRMQQEDEKGGSTGNGSNDRNSQNNSFDEEDDDELIDMEMDDCPSDDEHELDASH